MTEDKVVEAKPVAANNDLLVKALVIYALAPIGGLFYMNDADSFVKFNAKQGIYFGVAVFLLYVVASILSFLCFPIFIAGILHLGLVVYMVVKVKDGIKIKLPVIGDLAEK